MNEFATWASLLTQAGATAFVLLVVQFIKAPIDKVGKVPTRALVYIMALATLLLATWFTGGMTAEAAGMCVVNALVVAFAAMGAYEAWFNREKDMPNIIMDGVAIEAVELDAAKGTGADIDK